MRCWKLGQAIGRAIHNWDSKARVVVMGTGGLSHQLEGERAGHINKPYDQRFLDSLLGDPTWVTRQGINEIVREVGTQGIELLNWLVARAAMPGTVKEVHRTYHIPISNTAAAVMALEIAG